MLKAICDMCGKVQVLKYRQIGFESVEGWQVITQSLPLERSQPYRLFCPDCKQKFLKKEHKDEQQ